MRNSGKWTIAFFNPGKRPEGEMLFGCATLGAVDFNGVHAPDEEGAFVWKKDVQADVICGSFDECLLELGSLDYAPENALVFLARGLGAEAFLESFHRLCPQTGIAGGVSACLPGEAGELLPQNGDAAILLLRGGGFVPRAENIIHDTGRRFELTIDENPRRILEISTGEHGFRRALPAWRELQREFCVPEGNFECLTLSNAGGVNIHMHAEDGELISGANCANKGVYSLRFSTHSEIDEGAQAYCDCTGALVCGCAGLKGSMRRLPVVREGTLCIFLFGEIAHGAFGNLMMTGLFPR